eukprot:GSA120T00020318001.1
MFNCIGRPTAFAILKSAKPHPTALVRWLLRQSNKKIYLQSEKQHLVVKQVTSCIQ